MPLAKVKKPAPFRAAVFDIGSNSVKFMLAEQRGGTLAIHVDEAHTTRLGAALALTGKISQKSAKDTLAVLSACKKRADAWGASRHIVVGTSALRSAANSSCIREPARKILGSSIRVISGKMEGELVFAGATSHPRWQSKDILVIDVGGGSVEFVLGSKGKVVKSVSLPIGCVRIHDLFLQEQPPDPLGVQNALIYLENLITRKIARHLPPDLYTLGTGGTMVTLSFLHRNLPCDRWVSGLEGTRLEKGRLESLSQSLATEKLSRLKKNPSIPPTRADIIATGSIIYLSCLRALNLNSIHCATRGLRYGLWRKFLAPEPIKRIIPYSSGKR